MCFTGATLIFFSFGEVTRCSSYVFHDVICNSYLVAGGPKGLGLGSMNLALVIHALSSEHHSNSVCVCVFYVFVRMLFRVFGMCSTFSGNAFGAFPERVFYAGNMDF